MKNALSVRYIYRATITRVIDGDTFWATVDLGFRISAHEIFRVRNLNTPEIKRYAGVTAAEVVHGKQAKAHAEKLLPVGSEVTLRTYKNEPGAYARWEADVQLPTGNDYAAVMINHGFEKKTKYGKTRV